jgi:hypothetical protein
LGQQGKAAGLKENPWTLWLTRFRVPMGAPPKKLADYQHYMQHEDYKAGVAAVYNERTEGVKVGDRLAL